MFLLLLSYSFVVVWANFNRILNAITAAWRQFLELIECSEEAIAALKTVTWVVVRICIGLLTFEDFPFSILLAGLAAQIAHFYFINCPSLSRTSPSFVLSVMILFITHYLAITYFIAHRYSFYEGATYLYLCDCFVPIEDLELYLEFDISVPIDEYGYLD